MTTQQKPNILFLFSDQHKADVLSHRGHPDVQTPNLDRLAAQSVNFNRAYCQNNICMPSRTSMLTGQYPRTLDIFANEVDGRNLDIYEPLPEVLRQNGYRTVAVGKRHTAPPLEYGWDWTATTNSENDTADEDYLDWIRDRGQADEFSRDWQAEFGKHKASPMASRLSELEPDQTMEAYTAEKTIEFLRDESHSDQPFFLWSAFYRPHQPYTPVKKYADMYSPEKITLPANFRESIENLPPAMQKRRNQKFGAWPLAVADETLWRKYISYYYALVTEIDDHIGNILDVLEDEGLMENTIVIYGSDHGEFVGSHGMIEKTGGGQNMYEDTVRVPLTFRWPGRFLDGELSNDLVELVDIYPTLLELAGAKAPDGYSLPGRSLVPVLTGQQHLSRQYAVSENEVQLTAIGKRYKLSLWKGNNGDYPDVLFDRVNDPLETTNLIGQPGVKETEREMCTFLDKWMRQYSSPLGSW